MSQQKIKRRTRKIILKNALPADKSLLTEAEIKEVILRIKTRLWPTLKQRKAPRSCRKCRLIRFCKIIEPNLICPWPNKKRRLMKEETKEPTLKICIVTSGKTGIEDKGETFVVLKGEELIERFKNILNKLGRKRAIKFALSHGEIVDEPKDSAELILGEETVCWDLMPRSE